MEDEGPFEGVPDHLVEPLRDWIDHTFGGGPGSTADSEGGPRLAASLRFRIYRNSPNPLTVRQVTNYLIEHLRHDSLLDAADAVLYLAKVDPATCDSLDELLLLGGSAWQVGPNRDRLIRRVDPTATASFGDASSPNDVASAELGEAWTAAYARNPDASDAWDHSIKAVEAILIPIVTPTNGKATLGIVIKTLNDQGNLWCLALKGHDRSESAAPLVSMLRLMWPNPDRHGGEGSRRPTLMEAEAVVHLAVTIVHWARSGVAMSCRSSLPAQPRTPSSPRPGCVHDR